MMEHCAPLARWCCDVLGFGIKAVRSPPGRPTGFIGRTRIRIRVQGRIGEELTESIQDRCTGCAYSVGMKQVDVYRWRVPQKPPKKPYLTRYYMELEVGRARYPDGEPALEWKEVRTVCDTPDEISRAMASDLNPSYPPKEM